MIRGLVISLVGLVAGHRGIGNAVNGRFNLVYEDFIFECKLTLKHARFQRGTTATIEITSSPEEACGDTT